MIAIEFGYSLFSEDTDGCWLARQMWPSDYYDWLSQLDDQPEESG
jgi:hypothetical protein